MKTLVKHQRQRFSSNCGPTCVAMLAHISQKQACFAMFGEVLSELVSNVKHERSDARAA